ncbi:MAG: archaellum operon transcriptional activator EarA family protein [Methermicoccaceae archaeon]
MVSIEVLELIYGSRVRKKTLVILYHSFTPMYVSQIAKEIPTSPRNVSSALKDFKKYNLVAQVPHHKNAKLKFWKITGEGRRVVEEMALVKNIPVFKRYDIETERA